MFMFWVRCILA